jgi:glutamine phosphoribosylpyrophosphate amidotransferase
MADSIQELDGSFCYILASDQGLGVVRDRFGFKPMMLAETGDFVAAATEEIALHRILPSETRVSEPPPGSALFFPLTDG